MKLLKQNLRYGLVSYDAGGAEILSRIVKYFPDVEFIFFTGGPANSIYEKNLKRKFFNSSLQEISKCDVVIATTGWQTNFEIQIMKISKAMGIKTICLLDHWTNLEERFLLDSKVVLPDEIWALEEKTEIELRKIFMFKKVKIIENYLYKDLINLQKYSKKDKSKNIKRILYLTEPRLEKLLIYGNNDLFVNRKVFNYFYSNINFIIKNPYIINVRIHPSEEKSKYRWIYDLDTKIQFTEIEDILEDIMAADIIVGVQSNALITAQLLNKRVYSAVLPNMKSLIVDTYKIKTLRNFDLQKNLIEFMDE